MPPTTEASTAPKAAPTARRRWQQSAWFVGLWLAGVGAMAAMALLVRLLMHQLFA